MLSAIPEMSNKFLHFGLNIDIVQIRFDLSIGKFWKNGAIVHLVSLNTRSASTLGSAVAALNFALALHLAAQLIIGVCVSFESCNCLAISKRGANLEGGDI